MLDRPIGHVAFIFAMVGLALVSAACGGGVKPTPSSGGVEPFERYQAGGTFNAYYSGSVSSRSCGFKCTTETLGGRGHGSFLRKSMQSETLKIECAVEACSATGTATLTSTLHPGNTISIELSGDFGEIDNGSWSALGGTGKFANASGSGYWHTNYGTGTYSQSLSGTLNF